MKDEKISSIHFDNESLYDDGADCDVTATSSSRDSVVMDCYIEDKNISSPPTKKDAILRGVELNDNIQEGNSARSSSHFSKSFISNLARCRKVKSGLSIERNVMKRKDEGTIQPLPQSNPSRHLTRRRYRYLCGQIIVILFVELGILLSILVARSCSFYNMVVVNEEGIPYNMNVGLFGYSISEESYSGNPQCLSYDSKMTTESKFISQWVQETKNMGKTSQAFAIAAPILAFFGCGLIALEVFQPHYFPGVWLIVSAFFFAGSCQAFGIGFFNQKSVW